MGKDIKSIPSRVIAVAVMMLNVFAGYCAERIVRDGIEYALIMGEEPYLEVTNVYKEAGSDLCFPDAILWDGAEYKVRTLRITYEKMLLKTINAYLDWENTDLRSYTSTGT